MNKNYQNSKETSYFELRDQYFLCNSIDGQVIDANKENKIDFFQELYSFLPIGYHGSLLENNHHLR
jgi:hypothetical protein